jgi:hypothetical protein
VNQNVFLYVEAGEASPRERFIMASAVAASIIVVGVILTVIL